jgi:hypothetical protein
VTSTPIEKVNIAEAVVKFGTEAVLRYRDVAGLSDDSRMSEVFLGGFMAGRMYDSHGLNAQVERLYTDIAMEHGHRRSQELTRSIGGHRADIALYRDKNCIAVLEFKIFGESARLDRVIEDLKKLFNFNRLCDVDTYIGAFVTDTKNAPREARLKILSDALKHNFDCVGDVIPSTDGAWHWCFAAMRLPKTSPWLVYRSDGTPESPGSGDRAKNQQVEDNPETAT